MTTNLEVKDSKISCSYPFGYEYRNYADYWYLSQIVSKLNYSNLLVVHVLGLNNHANLQPEKTALRSDFACFALAIWTLILRPYLSTLLSYRFSTEKNLGFPLQETAGIGLGLIAQARISNFSAAWQGKIEQEEQGGKRHVAARAISR